MPESTVNVKVETGCPMTVLELLKLALDDYREHCPSLFSDELADIVWDPVDIDRLRAAVVADSLGGRGEPMTDTITAGPHPCAFRSPTHVNREWREYGYYCDSLQAHEGKPRVVADPPSKPK